MKKYNKILLLFIMAFFIYGCGNKQITPCTSPIIKTEFVEVKIPVMYNLERPKRPKKASNQSDPVYLNEILVYVRILEAIIDKTNYSR